MNRYIYVLLLVIGIIGFYSTAFADVCNTTVKCVCESNSLRVVPCPAEFSNDVIDCTKEGIPEGTCAVDCGQQVVAASCAEIPIECRNNETANCLVTLPIEAHSGCPFDEINCSGQCVDLSSDPNNCGSCGSSCPQFEECVSGSCMQPSCPPDLVFCSGAGCVDLSSDPNNCGSCGSSCSLLQECVSGLCNNITCPTGTVFCGPDAGCVDLSVNTSNCGGCGIQCNTPSEECVSGVCVPICNPGLDYCLGAGCVDLSSDELNCGGCGNECLLLCIDGACAP